MPGKHRKSKKAQLAHAIVDGIPISKWASENDVPRRTAYRWSKAPEVRALVDSHRRSTLDRAIGRMTRRPTWAADGIAVLGAKAESQSPKLIALPSTCSAIIT